MSRPARLIVTFAILAIAAGGLGWMVFGPGFSARAGTLIPYSDQPAVDRGKTLYDDNCASCHGANLEGQADWRRRDSDGYLPAPPHDATGHTWHHPDSQLFAITKHGTQALVGADYKTRMIGFGDSLDDAEILAVLAYIKSTWPDQIIARHNQINAAQD
jgi:mono/diheme cytochrome c family protein